MSDMAKLKTMKDEKIQEWLRKINPDDLKIGIQAVPQDIRNHIYRNLSKRANDVLSEFIKDNEGKYSSDKISESLKNLEDAFE